MGDGPGKDQLEQRQGVHGHALHQLFSCKSARKNLESGRLEGKAKHSLAG